MHGRFLMLLLVLLPCFDHVEAQTDPHPPAPLMGWTTEGGDWWLAEAQAQVRQIAEWSQGDPHRLRQLGQHWIAEGYVHLEPYLPYLGAHEIQSGSLDSPPLGLILALPAPRLHCRETGCSYPIYRFCERCEVILAYLPYQGPRPEGRGWLKGEPQLLSLHDPQRLIQDAVFEGGRLRLVDDFNGDGALELIVEHEHLMASGISRNWSVFREVGGTMRVLGTIRSIYAEPDLDGGVPAMDVVDKGDPSVRFRVPNHFIASNGAGLQRGGSRFYRLTDDAVEAVGFTPNRSSHPYYLAVDARTALGRGDLEAARNLTERGRAGLSEDHSYLDHDTRHQLQAYFGLLEMMIDLALVDPVGLQRRFNEVSQVSPNPMRDLAVLFFRELQQHGDAERACRRLEDESVRRTSEIRPLTFVGYATEELKVSCPAP